MNPDSLDPALLAAFVDGTLSATEREDVLRRLAHDPDALGDLLDVTAIKHELQPSSREVVPRRRSQRTSRPVRAVVGAGIVLVAASLVLILFRPRAPADARAAHALATSLAASVVSERGAGRSFEPAWLEPGWSVTRGATSELPPRARAFRIGARFVALDAALQLNDSATASRAAAQVSDLAAGFVGGAAAAARVTRLVAPALVSGETSVAAAGELRQLAPAPLWFDLGAWSNAARLAIRARSVDFFADDHPPSRVLRQLIEQLEQDSARLDATGTEVLSALRWIDAARADSVAGLEPLARRVAAIIEMAAS